MSSRAARQAVQSVAKLRRMLKVDSVSSSMELATDELSWLSSGTLARRDERLGSRDGRATRSRHLYFRPNADFSRLIAVCNEHIANAPGNVRARMIRASALLKKGVDSILWPEVSACTAVAIAAAGRQRPVNIKMHPSTPILQAPCSRRPQHAHNLN